MFTIIPINDISTTLGNVTELQRIISLLHPPIITLGINIVAINNSIVFIVRHIFISQELIKNSHIHEMIMIEPINIIILHEYSHFIISFLLSQVLKMNFGPNNNTPINEFINILIFFIFFSP